MKRFLVLFTFTMFVFVLNPPMTWSNPYLVHEPPLATQMSWDLAANGMLYVGYDLDGNSKPDFYTLRIVVRSFFAKEPPNVMASYFPENIVFFVNYGSSNFYYVAAREPMFYAADVNEDGHWDLIYKDVSEDGINGNETFYDSPSGMFSANIANF